MQPMEDSLCHCPRNPTPHHWVNLDHMQLAGSYHWNALCVPRVNSRILRWWCCELRHAEPVPAVDLDKPQHSVFYLPMHAVKKESSTTTKLRAVFDASTKSTSNVSLNDILLVGPTVHSPLIDVLLRFRLHRIALTADVSKILSHRIH